MAPLSVEKPDNIYSYTTGKHCRKSVHKCDFLQVILKIILRLIIYFYANVMHFQGINTIFLHK